MQNIDSDLLDLDRNGHRGGGDEPSAGKWHYKIAQPWELRHGVTGGITPASVTGAVEPCFFLISTCMRGSNEQPNGEA